MEDTAVAPEAGTDTGAEGNLGDAAGQTDRVDSANPQPEHSPEDKSRSADGKFAQPIRSLDELIDLADADMSQLSPEERRKVIKAGRARLRTEEEYEARFGKVKTADPLVDGEGNPVPAQPKPGAKPTDKGKPAAPAMDLSFLKEALPTLDVSKPEEVVKSLKEHQAHTTRLSQRVAEYEKAYPEIQAGLVERLQRGPDGLKEIFTQMSVTVPDWLGAAPAANGTKPAAQAAPQALSILEGLQDDDFVPASAVKGLVAQLTEQVAAKAVADAMAKMEATYGPIKKSHQEIQAEIAKVAQSNELQATRSKALSEAQFHSDFWGDVDPTEKLTEKADKIWEASVGPNGRILSQPHPEFAKLQKILVHRRQEYIDKGHPAANYEHYLYERLHKSGKYAEVVKSRERKAQEALVKKQQTRVQPSLVNKGVNGNAGLAGLKINSVEDVERVGRENPQALREWKRKAMRGG